MNRTFISLTLLILAAASIISIDAMKRQREEDQSENTARKEQKRLELLNLVQQELANLNEQETGKMTITRYSYRKIQIKTLLLKRWKRLSKKKIKNLFVLMRTVMLLLLRKAI
jgi:hypothetical protein